MQRAARVPPRAWVVAFAGTAVKLCLGILHAWSVWKKTLNEWSISRPL
jgi:MFS transporter, OFA family, oxalate/formate antiporter